MPDRAEQAALQPYHGAPDRLAASTSFFGREREIAELVDLLRGGPALVTVTGPGGVGKTRTALAVAASLDERGSPLGDAYVVPLASVADEGLVLPSIARAVGVLAQDERGPVERIAATLGDRRVFLVLDNLEHLPGAAVDIAALLRAVPGLTILATSRRALRISGEQEYPLSPLPAPRGEQALAVDELIALPSVQLFLARASAANPQFALTESNAPAIARICARLDGLPLAIELAAARIKLLSPQALANRLTASLQLLTSGPRDVPRRQQTLRDTIEWSHELLTAQERILFRRLAVFAGGATLDAIEAVAALPGDQQPIDALETIAALVDHSLVVQEETGGETRFRMLETVREFALEQLRASGELAVARDAHGAVYLRQAELVAEPEYLREEARQIALLTPELDNVRAALTWYIDEQPPGSERRRLGLRLAAAMIRFWDVRGYLQEELAWLRKALAGVPETPSFERATALTGLGVNAWFSGDLDEADRWQRAALADWRMLGDHRNEVRSTWFRAIVAAKRHDVAALLRLADEADALVGDIGTTLWVKVPVAMRGLAALGSGDAEGAEALLRDVLAFHAEHGYLWPHAWTLGVIAIARQMRGDQSGALRLHQQSTREFHEHGDVYATLDGLLAVAGHAVAFGQAEAAARLLGVVAAIRPAIGTRITWESVDESAVHAAAAAALGPQRVAEAMHEGHGMSLTEAVALAASIEPSPTRTPAPAADTPVDATPFGLSPRELDVLRLLADGKSNQEIGEALYISPRTAGTHVTNILGKLGVNSRSAAVGLALSRGLV